MRGGVNSEPEAGDSMPREKRKFLSFTLCFSVGGIAFKPFYETYGRYSVYLNLHTICAAR
jgi:hypothetical protein